MAYFLAVKVSARYRVAMLVLVMAPFWTSQLLRYYAWMMILGSRGIPSWIAWFGFGDVQIITEASVAAAHALGLEIHAWTINDEAEMERLLDLGVDALMTDFPARAFGVLRRRGLRR